MTRMLGAVLCGALIAMSPAAHGAERMSRRTAPFVLLESMSGAGTSSNWILYSYPDAALNGMEQKLTNGSFVDLYVPPSRGVRIGIVSDCQQCKWELQLKEGAKVLDSWEANATLLGGASMLIRRDRWAAAAVTLGGENAVLDLAMSALAAKFRSIDPDQLTKERTLRVTLVNDISGSTAFRLFALQRP